MTRSRLLLVGTLILFACVKKPATEYTFVFQGSDEDYPAAIEATAEWNACGDVHVMLTRVGEGIPIREVAWPIVGPPTCPCDGYTPPRQTEIQYTRNQDVRATLAHEMGHAFGLDHDVGQRIMSPMWIVQREAEARVTTLDCDAIRQR